MVFIVPCFNGDCFIYILKCIFILGDGVDKFFKQSIDKTLIDLASCRDGLTEKQVAERADTRKDDMKNIKKQSLVSRFFEQFFDFMIIVLLVASAISIIIGIVERTAGEIVDGCIILAIVIMNAIFGVAQEYKAEKSLEALNKLSQPECFVLREGIMKKISTPELVIGDIVVLDSGSIVPADLRLIESHQMKVDESALTGESFSVEKDCRAVFHKDVALGERKNIAYKGTVVAGGRGQGVVVALGEDTEFGKIAKAIKEDQKELTPLQKSIKDVGKVLTYLVLVIAVVTFIMEICITPNGVMEAFLTAVAIAVAAIPESMPAVITIIMSMGVARLAKQKAIVRKMHAVETLGCCDVICSDKTGTITQNKMTISSLYWSGNLQTEKIALDADGEKIILAGLLCNDAVGQGGGFIGDPTEVAIAEFAKSRKFEKNEVCKQNPRINEIPFDSNRKLMSVLCQTREGKVVFAKGAFDRIVDKCNKILIDGKEVDFGKVERERVLNANNQMCEKALRVIAFAYKCQGDDNSIEEENLVFLGLMGMFDPPRKEIEKAVKKCRKAGMKPVMITGDYSQTALAIAKQIGLAKSEKDVLTGERLAKMKNEELEKTVEKFSVFARVTPEDKVRIVAAFKKRGRVVAMTGDGVNDAPSLKKANIGIGMGKSGTDVAKEVSDLIITDDNFATIIVAVEEGRKIYQNIQKTVKFLFSANLAELLSLFVVTLMFPQYVFLFPVQILFVNLISDSFPAIALGVEEPEESLMEMPPRKRKSGLFSNGIGVSIVVLGIAQTLMVVIAYIVGLKFFGEGIAVTMAFYTLNIVQFFFLASMRTSAPFYKSKPFKNKMFLLAEAFCFVLVGLFAFSPLRHILKLEMLSLAQWLIIFGLSFAMLLISEIYKVIEKKIIKKA